MADDRWQIADGKMEKWKDGKKHRAGLIDEVRRCVATVRARDYGTWRIGFRRTSFPLTQRRQYRPAAVPAGSVKLRVYSPGV